MSKDEDRKFAKTRRKSIAGAERIDKENKIAERTAQLVGCGKRVMAYYSYNNEVGTSALIAKLIDQRNEVFLPRVKGDEIEVVPYECGKGSKDCLFEPSGQAVDKSTLDCVIVPLVAFDNKRNRLGYGKGFYDRFLKNLKAQKIGIGFAVQEVANIETEAHDFPLDKIVTENGEV